jgi:hypothetical protein
VRDVAVIYRAQLVPSKLDLLKAWVPSQPWLGDADTSSLEVLGAYRFDDPDGEVGIETLLVQTGDGRMLQVPWTYRGAQLADGHGTLVATMEHSVLGKRWVYDGCSDAVYANALARAILTGGEQADLEVQTDDGPLLREPTTRVVGSGNPAAAVAPVDSVTWSDEDTTTVIVAGAVKLVVLRVIGHDYRALADSDSLAGVWPGQDDPAVLAVASPRVD